MTLDPALRWPPPGYHTVAQAAAILGLSRQRVHVLIRTRRVPVERTPQGFVLTTAAVERLRIRRHKPAGRPPKAQKAATIYLTDRHRRACAAAW
jgi:hypothetical protein